MDLNDHLRALEEALLRNTGRRDAACVAALLADEFQEFGSSGRVYTKAEIIAHLQEEPESSLHLRSFAAASLSASLVHVTYRAVKSSPGSAPTESLRSSLWALRDGRWQMLFHQGTRVAAST